LVWPFLSHAVRLRQGCARRLRTSC